jgi:coenzyme F420 hydrogenase subunit beta
MTSWLLCELLRSQRVDAVLHVTSGPDHTDLLFQYGVSTTVEAVRQNAKSRYYPVEASQVISHVLTTPGRYVFVGVPCFVKGVRLLQETLPVLRERIVFTVALFCGQLKSTAFARALAWQMGIPPDRLTGIDFRTKVQNEPASAYSVSVTGMVGGDKVTKTAPASSLFGTDWGLGLFKYKACDYCDDIVGETADVSFGDAWLRGWAEDWRGSNVIVCRNVVIEAILREGMTKSDVCLQAITPEVVEESQAGSFRHRREYLGYRLAKARRNGVWHPPKRYGKERDWPVFVRRQQDLRMLISARSHEVFAEALARNDLTIATQALACEISRYRRIVNPTWRRILRRCIKGFRQVMVRRSLSAAQ